MLSRTTPLRHTRTAPRREPTVSCIRGGCRRPPRYFDWCKTHAIEVADRLFSEFIHKRDRMCQECGGRSSLECAHLQPRTKFATRWDPQNAVALCFNDHLHFTANPDEWTEWCVTRLGADAWELLTLQANLGGMPNLETVITDLRKRVREVS